MTKHKENCDCLFCNSKCPECGSTDITVKYQPTFEYENSTRNLIMINRGTDCLEVQCQQCGAEFKMDEFTTDHEIEPLRKALSATLKIPSCIHIPIDDYGGIEPEEHKIEILPL